jgi:hypothetical protein
MTMMILISGGFLGCVDPVGYIDLCSRCSTAETNFVETAAVFAKHAVEML